MKQPDTADLLKEISAVKDSMADIITGFTHAVADLQKKDIGTRVHPDTLKALNEICTNFVVEVGKQLMAHRDRQLELQIFIAFCKTCIYPCTQMGSYCR